MTTSEFQPFHGLPISHEQDAEIHAYMTRCKAVGQPWDTLALDYIIKDILYPSPSDDRLDFCSEYAEELANRSRLRGEVVGCHTQEIYSLVNGIYTESEWPCIVHEAAKIVKR